MVNKYAGVCHSCGVGVGARAGLLSRDGRRWLVHCHGCAGDGADVSAGGAEDEIAGFEPGTLANDRRMARRGVSVFRFSSGEVMTQNSRGRCEDAPCCGCCS